MRVLMDCPSPNGEETQSKMVVEVISAYWGNYKTDNVLDDLKDKFYLCDSDFSNFSKDKYGYVYLQISDSENCDDEYYIFGMTENFAKAFIEDLFDNGKADISSILFEKYVVI